MTAQPAAQVEPAGRSECWCCGTIEDQSRTGLGVQDRDQFRRLREAVVARGWHRSRLIGRPLRWIGKHTP